jgi:hypothetical protein
MNDTFERKEFLNFDEVLSLLLSFVSYAFSTISSGVFLLMLCCFLQCWDGRQGLVK